MKNNKIPGLDGFTVELVLMFWDNIDHFILNSIYYRYRIGSLRITQKLGVISQTNLQ